MQQRREQADKLSGLRRTGAGVALGLILLTTIPPLFKSTIQDIRHLPNPEMSMAVAGSSLAIVLLVSMVVWLIYSGVQRYKTPPPTISKDSTDLPPLTTTLPSIPLNEVTKSFLPPPVLNSDVPLDDSFEQGGRDDSFEEDHDFVEAIVNSLDKPEHCASLISQLYTRDLKEQQTLTQNESDNDPLLASEDSIRIIHKVIGKRSDQVEALKEKIQSANSEPQYSTWAKGLIQNIQQSPELEYIRTGTVTPPPTTDENDSSSRETHSPPLDSGSDPLDPDSPSSKSSGNRNNPSPTQYTLSQTFLAPPPESKRLVNNQTIEKVEQHRSYEPRS